MPRPFNYTITDDSLNNKKKTYQTFRCIPSEKCFTRFTRNGIKVVSKSFIAANSAILVFFVFPWLLWPQFWRDIHWTVDVCHGWYSITIWVLKTEEEKFNLHHYLYICDKLCHLKIEVSNLTKHQDFRWRSLEKY